MHDSYTGDKGLSIVINRIFFCYLFAILIVFNHEEVALSDCHYFVLCIARRMILRSISRILTGRFITYPCHKS